MSELRSEPHTNASAIFRYGVRSLICERRQSLFEILSEELSQKPSENLLSAIELIELGAVYVNDERTLNPDLILRKGGVVRVHTCPRRFARPVDLASRIIAETADTILVEKPAELPLEPTVDNLRENLISFLQDFRGQVFFPVHRLTPESSGVILLAKSVEAQARLRRAFREGRIKRTYVAYVESALEMADYVQDDCAFAVTGSFEMRTLAGTITENLASWTVSGGVLPRAYRLEIVSMTCRPLQIRARLAALGAPVIGDRSQGSRFQIADSETKKAALALRAIRLEEDRQN